ncbi:MAG: adenylate/guanylate cyclase domain-containing protein [Anaerolineae bacterium]
MSVRILDQQHLYGNWGQRFLREVLTNSSVFWIFDLARQTTQVGLADYLSAVPHWVMFGSSIAQAWVICRNPRKHAWWHYFIAVSLYTLIDIVLDGATSFFSEPYHVLYWQWAAGMAIAYFLQNRVAWIAALLKSLLLVLLLPASYMLSEWNVASVNIANYWLNDSAHLFILLGTIILGILLGTANLMRDRFERLLYGLAGHFEQIASWSFDANLIQKSYEDDHALALQSIERTVLFMDIRGFTPWSEVHSPEQVVELINQFYCTAEPIIKAHDGFKIQMTGDEIMTRFSSADQAVKAAEALQTALSPKLSAFGLSVGIGVHSGKVIEGLVGGEQTRQYGIFGDTVNIAARLQAQAQSGEVIIGQSTWNKLTTTPAKYPTEKRSLALKGKADRFSVVVLMVVPSKRVPMGRAG